MIKTIKERVMAEEAMLKKTEMQIIAEFESFCNNEDQVIGAMASEIRSLRITVERLQDENKALLDKIYNGGE